MSIAKAAPIGRLAAEALHRPHTTAATLSAVTPASADTSLLIVADAAECSLAGLFPLLRSCAEVGVRVGLLTGRDLAGQVFGLAKILAASSGNAPCADLLLEGSTGCAHDLVTDAPIPLAEAIGQDTRHLVVDAHGSAAHAHLGPYLLCGLTGDAERTMDGQVIPAGCTRTRCKIARDAPLQLLRPHELRTRVLGLFVCNAITLTPAEQYPSNVALALDACDGYPSATFGLLRGDAATGSAEPAHTTRLLRAGLPLGEVVYHLNRPTALHGISPSILLLGDPDQGALRTSPQHRHTPTMSTGALAPPRSTPVRNTPTTWEESLLALCQQRPDPELAACLEQMRQARATASATASTSILEEAAQTWAQAALDILHRTRSGSFGRLFTALSAPLLAQVPQSASSCPYCGSPRNQIAENGRFALTCPRCGPAAVGSNRLNLTLNTPSRFAPGHEFAVQVAVSALVPAPVLVALQLRNRSTARGAYATATLRMTPGHSTACTLRPPTAVEPELHRVWAVAAHHFDLALVQNRIPALPTPDMLT
ncbi:hypothetical protein HCN51_39390 [Nonomuraea sp. FMUSA5-5]|uniref:Uncharacterized protein n=1 Tax=Nonomuraea composti TaxID=2720023 RepID=A0ABX1BJG5_9ACTN|nr:hypothetical protein [Nonomuraea sp. FMUSA5-5]NJP95436.1 hypothetical protein [Nonomuraea sp. FMUSA5-5]